jgi:copper chaperone CopZ
MTTTTSFDRHTLSLDIVGMTCASCANRIEKRLNRIDGVTATVNYATEKAKVTVDGDTDRDELVAAVRAAGYDVVEPAPTSGDVDNGDTAGSDDNGATMVPALQFDGWQWLSLTLAAPVVVWGALAVPPGRLAQPAPRCGHDGHPHLGRHARRVRLVAVRAVPRRRREIGMRSRVLLPRAGHGPHEIYLEVAPPASPCSSSPVATSRPRQASLRGRAAGAARARRQGRRRAPRRRPRSGSHRPSSSSATSSSSGPARRSPPTAWSSRAARRPSTRRCSPASRCPSRSDPATRSPAPPSTPADARRARHPRRRRHAAGPDRPPRRGGPDRQGARAAARRPGLGGLRARRHRPRLATLGFWLTAASAATPPASPPRSPC